MAKFEKRLLAERLRKKGLSIKEIAKRLEVSKGTVSVWCSGIVLSCEQQEVLNRKMSEGSSRGRILGSRTNHDKKVKIVSDFIKEGERYLKNFSSREKILIISMLYWGEGSKKDSRFSFSNSDPLMIKIMADLLVNDMGIVKSRLAPRLFINSIHKPRIDKVLKFWSNLLELPVSQFGNPVFINRNPKKIYSNYDDYYGVLALKVGKSSNLKYEIMGYIEAVKKNVGVAQLVVAPHS